MLWGCRASKSHFLTRQRAAVAAVVPDPVHGSAGTAPSGARLSSQPSPESFTGAFKGKRQFRKLKAFWQKSEWLLETNGLFSRFFASGCQKAAFKCSFCIVSIENHADAGLKRSQTQNHSDSTSTTHLLTGGPQGHVFHCTLPPHVPRGSEPGQTTRLVAAAV